MLVMVIPFLLALTTACSLAAGLVVFLGYMVVTGIVFNAITLSLCVIGAGFSVDYFTHVAFFAVNNIEPSTPWTARKRQSLESCGYAIFQANIGQSQPNWKSV